MSSNQKQSASSSLVEDAAFCGNSPAHSAWDEIIVGSAQHGEDSTYKLPTAGGIVLLTINYPRVDKFVNMSAAQQKELYKKVFREVCASVPIEQHKSNRLVFEYCNSGQVHCHGYLELTDTNIIPIGLLADMAKSFHRLCPKVKFHRYHMYNDKHMFIQYGRYKDPGICLQYLFPDDTKGFERWVIYMGKQQA